MSMFLSPKVMQQSLAPSYVKQPSMRQTESGSLVLEFTLKSAYEPRVSWLLNSRPLTSGGRISTNMVGKMAGNAGIYTISMEISQLTLADVGKYQAVVRNTRGQTVTTATFTLTGTQLRGMTILNWLLLLETRFITFSYI